MAKPLYEPGAPRWRVTYLGKPLGTVEAPDAKSAIAGSHEDVPHYPAKAVLDQNN